MYKAGTTSTTNCLFHFGVHPKLSTMRRSRRYQARIKNIQSFTITITLLIFIFITLLTHINTKKKNVCNVTRSFFEKKKKSKYLFVHLRGKELYRFLLSSIKGTSTLLVIASRREQSSSNGRSNHKRRETKARVVKSFPPQTIEPILVLRSSVYRAALWNRNVRKENFFTTSVHEYRTECSFTNRCFRFVSIVQKPEFGINLGPGNSIRLEGVRELFIGAIGSPTLRYKSRGGTRADVTISSVPWKPGSMVQLRETGSLGRDQLRLRVL